MQTPPDDTIAPTGFSIVRELYRGRYSRVLQARCNSDGRQIALKVIGTDSVPASAIAALEHEQQLLSHFRFSVAPKAEGMETRGGYTVSALELIEGTTLLQTPHPEPDELPRVILALTQALTQIHETDTIHGNLQPRHLMLRARDGAGVLLDFTQANTPQHRLTGNQGTTDPATLAYHAPELMRAPDALPDSRSDLYSLGVCLYEWLSGSLPFEAGDGLETMHQQVAREATPLHEVAPTVPVMLSRTVQRLMAKNPSERYQNTRELEDQLHACLADSSQSTGVRDDTHTAGPIALPHNRGLFGREREQRVLEETLERVMAGGRELALVGGSAGVGKTSLINEFRPRLRAQGGIWISGKFDQLGRDLPYSAIVEALRREVRHWLSENDRSLARHAEKLHLHLGSNLELMTGLIPELALITGDEGTPQETGSFDEARNRFVHAFLNFLQLFCDQNRPLVLFLDDLQWMDAASVSLLEAILKDNTLDRLLILGAYRDDETDQTHPVNFLVEALQHARLPLIELHLPPLQREAVIRMLCAMLEARRDQIMPLADLLMPRTQGNPFYIHQFLGTLHRRGLLRYNPRDRRWDWDIDIIRQAPLPDKLVDLVLDQLDQLPEPEAQLLSLAACIGSRFPLHLLAHHRDCSTEAIQSELGELVAQGLIFPSSGDSAVRRYSFAHDRIQEAAYARLDRRQRLETHLEFGRQLLNETDPDKERVMEAASHLNLGLELITDQTEREQVAELNLEVGRKARQAAAFDTAFNYFRNGLELLGPEGRTNRHRLWLDLNLAGADAAHLANHPDALQEFADNVWKYGNSQTATLQIYEILLTAALARNDLQQALKLGYEASELMGIHLPRNPGAAHVLWHMGRARMALGTRSITSLSHLPRVRSTSHEAQLSILRKLTNVAYWASPNLVPVLAAHQLRLTLRRGNNHQSPMVYAIYGMLIGAIFYRIKRAYQFSQLAMELHEQMPSRQEAPELLLTVNAFITHWRRPIQHVLPNLLEAHRLGQDVGKPSFASYGAWSYDIFSLHAGRELNGLAREMSDHSASMLRSGQITTFYGNELYHQTVLNLLGRSSNVCRLVGECYDEDEMRRVHEEASDLTELFVLHANKTMLCCLFGRHEEGLENADKTRRYLDSALGTFSIPAFVFHETLLAIARVREVSLRRRQTLKRRIRRNLKRLKLWSRHAPENHRQKYLLAMAEYKGMKNRKRKSTAQLYHGAISAARANGLIHEEAMALERCAHWYSHQPEQNWLAGMLLIQAHRKYGQWGAQAKTQALEETYPNILTRQRTGHRASGATHTLDFQALRKSLGRLAREKVQSHIIEQTLRTAVEFAGAETGYLLLPPLDGSTLVAEGEYQVGEDSLKLMHAIPFEQCERLLPAVVRFVQRSGEALVIEDAQSPQNQLPGLNEDPQVIRRRVRSVLCMPIQVEESEFEQPQALIYLENNLAPGVFTESRVEILEVIGLAAATTLQLSREAATDGLTGLYNFRYFRELLDKEVRQARRQQRPLSLIMLDIDRFKRFNDRWGHQAGDEVLARVARAVREAARGADLVARYGGEELAVVLPETDADGARQAAENLRTAIADTTVEYRGLQLQVTASFGTATLDPDVPDSDALISAADQALYRAKRAGRNQVLSAN